MGIVGTNRHAAGNDGENAIAVILAAWRPAVARNSGTVLRRIDLHRPRAEHSGKRRNR